MHWFFDIFLDVLEKTLDGLPRGGYSTYWGTSEQIGESTEPTYSCIQDWAGGGTGHISGDPLFADPGSSDYHLQPDSPCIDAGTNTPPGGLPSEDLDGNPRPQDGDYDGGATADMGAYEFTPVKPAIGLSANQFDFTAGEYLFNPADQILSISNYGVGTLNWIVTESCDWLVAIPMSGSSTGESNDVTLSVDISGLSQGVYSCDLTVSDPNAANSPQTVQVNLTIAIECVKDTAPFYDDWVGAGKNWGRPDCWCYERQCRGNTDGIKDGSYRVSQADLLTFLDAFNQGDLKMDQTKICADFDHRKAGSYRCSQDDLLIFLRFFNKGDLKVPVCPMDWEESYDWENMPDSPGVGDGDDDYNFWITP